MLLLLYVVFQLAVGAALLLQGLILAAIVVLVIGPLVGLLVADALLVYLRIARSLHTVREALSFGQFRS